LTMEGGISPTPGHALKELLVDYAYYGVRPRVWISSQKLARLGFQRLAVEMLVNEYSIRESKGLAGVIWKEVFEGRVLTIHGGKGLERYEAEVVSGDGEISWRDLEARLPDPPFPLIAVDLGLWRLHSEEEIAKLRIQVAMSLSVVREYLWDRHLALTSATGDIKESLQTLMGRNKALITSARPNELLWSVGAEEIIILRPDAPEDLTPEDVMKAQAFLIGGIVDLIPRRGISRVLDRMVPWGKPRRITLRGSIIGVPDRINRIVEILLKARFLYRGDIERAIVSSMSKRDVSRRLFVEVMRASESRGGRRVIRAEKFDELREWLPISWEDFLEAARKAKAEVVGGEGSGGGS